MERIPSSSPRLDGSTPPRYALTDSEPDDEYWPNDRGSSAIDDLFEEAMEKHRQQNRQLLPRDTLVRIGVILVVLFTFLLSVATTPQPADLRIAEWIAGLDEAADAVDRPLLPIQWLHVPKTGSTFGLTAYRHACNGPEELDSSLGVDCSRPIYSLTTKAEPSRYCVGGFVNASRLNDHPPAVLGDDWGHLVNMFRSPPQHKASMLEYVLRYWSDGAYLERCGLPSSDSARLQRTRMLLQKMFGLDAAATEQALLLMGRGHERRSLCAWMGLLLRHMRGCQAKMIAGQQCLQPLGPQQAAQTARLVAQAMPEAFKFVGLVERWPESVCLMHQQLRSRNPPSPYEFINSRPSLPPRGVAAQWNDWAKEKIDVRAEADKCGLVPLIDTDDLDDPVYERAVDIFDAELVPHRASVQRCVASAREAAAQAEPLPPVMSFKEQMQLGGGSGGGKGDGGKDGGAGGKGGDGGKGGGVGKGVGGKGGGSGGGEGDGKGKSGGEGKGKGKGEGAAGVVTVGPSQETEQEQEQVQEPPEFGYTRMTMPPLPCAASSDSIWDGTKLVAVPKLAEADAALAVVAGACVEACRMPQHQQNKMAKYWLTDDAVLNTHGGVTYPHCWECLASSLPDVDFYAVSAARLANALLNASRRRVARADTCWGRALDRDLECPGMAEKALLDELLFNKTAAVTTSPRTAMTLGKGKGKGKGDGKGKGKGDGKGKGKGNGGGNETSPLDEEEEEVEVEVEGSSSLSGDDETSAQCEVPDGEWFVPEQDAWGVLVLLDELNTHPSTRNCERFGEEGVDFPVGQRTIRACQGLDDGLDRCFCDYSVQCTSQCDAVPEGLVEACYCRACAALPSWGALMALCERFGLPDVPECVRFGPLDRRSSCGVPGPGTGGADDGGATQQPPATAVRTEYGTSAVPADAPCVTSFGTACCPAPRADASSPCGEASGRGRCVGIDTWMAAQALPPDADASCQWPVLMGAARCLCAERFWGDDCGGCASGYAGEHCERRLQLPQRRKSFLSLSYEELVRWSDLFVDGLGRLDTVRAVRATNGDWMLENYLEVVHERSLSTHYSEWLDHWHILYFEFWLASLRKATGEYDLPYFYFDPSDRHSLSRLNKFLSMARANSTAARERLRERLFNRSTAEPFYVAEDATRMNQLEYDVCGNLRAEVRDMLVERVSTFFPSRLGFNTSAFAARTPEAIEALARAPAGSPTWSGSFNAYFLNLHRSHQGTTVIPEGPCNPKKLSRNSSLVERLVCSVPLGPTHAFYEKLFRDWMKAHGRGGACALATEDADSRDDGRAPGGRRGKDMRRGSCIPYVTPLVTLGDLCTSAYDERSYEGPLHATPRWEPDPTAEAVGATSVKWQGQARPMVCTDDAAGQLRAAAAEDAARMACVSRGWVRAAPRRTAPARRSLTPSANGWVGVPIVWSPNATWLCNGNGTAAATTSLLGAIYPAKSGSSTLGALMEGVGGVARFAGISSHKHDAWADVMVRWFGRERWDGALTLSIARNPWSRLVSFFEFAVNEIMPYHCYDMMQPEACAALPPSLEQADLPDDCTFPAVIQGSPWIDGKVRVQPWYRDATKRMQVFQRWVEATADVQDVLGPLTSAMSNRPPLASTVEHNRDANGEGKIDATLVLEQLDEGWPQLLAAAKCDATSVTTSHILERDTSLLSGAECDSLDDGSDEVDADPDGSTGPGRGKGKGKGTGKGGGAPDEAATSVGRGGIERKNAGKAYDCPSMVKLPFACYYSSKLGSARDIVARFYAEDIARFGYAPPTEQDCRM